MIHWMNIESGRKMKKKISFDIARIIAISMVVVIHANVSFIQSTEGFLFKIGTHITGSMTICVPLFFMVSGALLLNLEQSASLRSLLEYRVKKIFVPFFIWSIIYLLVRMLFGKVERSIGTFFSIIKEPAYYQFWFIYTLLAIYLLLPFLYRVVKSCSEILIKYALSIWVLFSMIIPMTERYFGSFSICEHFNLNFLEGYLGYFLLGYYLYTYKRNVSKRYCILAIIIGLLGTHLGIIMEQEFLQFPLDSQYIYAAYLTPFVMLTASGILCLLFKLDTLYISEKKKKCIEKSSKMTMGVFYNHMLVLMGIEYTGVLASNSLVGVGIKVIGTIVISFFVSYIISKCPILNKLLI